MSINPLNDISKVYLEQVSSVDEAVKGADSEMRRAASAERRGGDKRLSPSTGRGYADQQKQSIAFMNRLTKKNKNVVGLVTKEGLDPVGKEDKDIDNDGDHDKSDKYLLNRRKVRGKAIATRKEGYYSWREGFDLFEVSEKGDKEDTQEKIKEKTVNNKIKINPSISETVESLGGTLIEMLEIDEVDYLVESVYDELFEEGYDVEDIEEALEFALTEAKVTFGHDTPVEKKKNKLLAAAKEKLSGAKKAAKAAVARGARKVAKKALGVARKMENDGNKPSAAHTKTRTASTYRGAGAGQKEKVSSGSYKAPSTAKKKAEKPADPWEGSATTPPKPKAKTKKVAAPKAKAKAPAAAAPKRKRKSKLDDLLASVRSEETQLLEKMDLAKASMGDVIRDFRTSKAPQFAGKSKKKKQQMAIAAKLTAERGGKKLGEQNESPLISGEKKNL